MTQSYWHHTARPADLTADVAIVGGGVIGVSTGYWLKRFHPDFRVIVLEAHTLAAGASGRNAGFLLQGTHADYATDRTRLGADRARRLWAFTLENRRLVEQELYGPAFGLEATGSWMLAGSADEADRLDASATALREEGVEATYHAGASVRSRLGADAFEGGLFLPTGATVHPVRLVRHVARRGGLKVIEHAPVRGAVAGGGGVRLDTPARGVTAGRVVFALNAYLPRLFPDLGRFVRPVRAQMCALAPRPRRLKTPVYSHDGYFYLRQDRTGTVLVGGARHLFVEQEIGYEDAVSTGVQAALADYLHTHFPGLAESPVVQRWSGTMGFSPDGLPAVGVVPDLPGAWWAAGFTGHGMGYGFRFGRLLAEVVLGRSDPEGADLFSARRFDRQTVAGSV